MVLPTRAISAAFARPTIRGSNQVPPLSGTIPRFANPGFNFAPDEAIRMSAPKVMSSPYPAAPPLRAQTIGVSMLYITTGGAVRRSNSTPEPTSPRTPRPLPPAIWSVMSRPAQKTRPVPVRTTHLTDTFSSAARRCLDSSTSIVPEIVFKRSGALRLIIATCPSN